ncbi:heat shock protein HspQ [Thiohalorhabdus methylotrophus]|uniref:Heat shock protein HspQ n=1 Tax=Thiohalorhabdus methylotrophus TaxID=3242694 RepID=A0ABV4TU69_9GAMM
MIGQAAKFSLGQIVWHLNTEYRGVIVDVDPEFQGEEEWLEGQEETGPNRNQPWYSLLVDDTEQMAYVPEQNLATDDSEVPINNPAMDFFVGEMEDGRYTVQQTLN